MHRLVREALHVAKLDHLICQETQAPPAAALRRLRAGQPHEVRLTPPSIFRAYSRSCLLRLIVPSSPRAANFRRRLAAVAVETSIASAARVSVRERILPGPKPEALLARYGLKGRTVLLTLGRLPVQEKRKGHDEVPEVLPSLAEEQADIVYLVCGDGDDRARLEEKAWRLELNERVIFASYVPEEEKADHYRLADAFVMPGRTEGFGIVYLKALACGVPVVTSSADASQEAVRRGAAGCRSGPRRPADLPARHPGGAGPGARHGAGGAGLLFEGALHRAVA